MCTVHTVYDVNDVLQANLDDCGVYHTFLYRILRNQSKQILLSKAFYVLCINLFYIANMLISCSTGSFEAHDRLNVLNYANQQTFTRFELLFFRSNRVGEKTKNKDYLSCGVFSHNQSIPPK